VGLPVLVIDDGLMTDLTSIGTLFAFVLVCGGVLLLPPKEKEVDSDALDGKVKKTGKFNLPYINGKFIVPVLVLLFIVGTFPRLSAAFSNIGNENYQEILFLVFVILALYMAVVSALRNYSLIPVLGLLCCSYLMIEIPAKSWLVFFGWMGLGLLIYFSYGAKHSKLN
jgi:hypothetical protein